MTCGLSLVTCSKHTVCKSPPRPHPQVQSTSSWCVAHRTKFKPPAVNFTVRNFTPTGKGVAGQPQNSSQQSSSGSEFQLVILSRAYRPSPPPPESLTESRYENPTTNNKHKLVGRMILGGLYWPRRRSCSTLSHVSLSHISAPSARVRLRASRSMTTRVSFPHMQVTGALNWVTLD
jgi:hypothetical protein